jgi:hypothetical protein
MLDRYNYLKHYLDRANKLSRASSFWLVSLERAESVFELVCSASWAEQLVLARELCKINQILNNDVY